MKKLILLLFIFISSCGVTKTSSSGIENQSFLSFETSDKRNYPEGVEVILDDKTSFKAEVFKNRDKVKHIRLYGISTGKHKVSVLFNGKVIYEKTIFLSSQQTKKIILP